MAELDRRLGYHGKEGPGPLRVFGSSLFGSGFFSGLASMLCGRSVWFQKRNIEDRMPKEP